MLRVYIYGLISRVVLDQHVLYGVYVFVSKERVGARIVLLLCVVY
jgi:hypothetical protein